jgi:hypothetical protein
MPKASVSAADQEGVWHLQAQLRPATDALDRARQGGAQVRLTVIAYNLRRTLTLLRPAVT